MIAFRARELVNNRLRGARELTRWLVCAKSGDPTAVEIARLLPEWHAARKDVGSAFLANKAAFGLP
jgi:hypothetical protein